MSGFDLWKTNSPPVVTFSTLSTPPLKLTESGKGLPPGWVSQWGDKKVQKQTDGNWAHVPQDTPLGMQPYFKGSGETLTLTPEQEMMGYLKSVNFDDPATQKTFTGSPKFVGDMLKKFGAGWFDKYKGLAGKPGITSPGAPPAPVAPPPPPVSMGSPIEQAMKQLNIAAGSKEAFAVEAFHKSGSLEAAVDAYSKKFGIKYATAYDNLDALMKKGSGKGTWSYSGDFDDGYKITFNIGTGPVISAPAVAATASAPSLGIVEPPPAPVKAKKPKASLSTPVPPALPVPPMKGTEVPIEPKVIALAQKLGYAADSDVAKVLDVWRKRLQTGVPGITHGTAQKVALISGWSVEKSHQFLLDLLSKVAGIPGWDVVDFSVDSGGLGPELKKPEPISTPIPSTVPPPAPPTSPAVIPPPGLKPAPEVPPTLALDKAVSDMVAKLGYKMGSAGAVAVAMLTTHDGDINAAAHGLAASLGWTSGAAFKVAKFVQAKMNAFKAGTDVPEAPALVAKLIGASPGTGGKPEKKKKARAVPDIQQTIPPIATLNFAGDAKSKLGGNKPKKFVKDEQGNLYLHKHGADQLRAAGGEVASNIAGLVVGPGFYVPVKATEYEGDWGTVQPMVQNVVKNGLPTDPTLLSMDDIKQLQRERVLDWVTSSHDTKIGNFIKTKSGQIFGVDKEQAFKFIGSDALSLDYKPNPSEPYYNPLYKAYANKEIDLDPNDMVPFIKNVEKTSDTDWLKAVKPYLDALPPSDRDAKAQAILDRKNNVRKDFEAFFTTLKKKRGEYGAFQFAGGPPPAPETAVSAEEPPLKKKPVGLGALVPPDVPPMSALKYSGAATAIGGAGEKHFYTDSDGKKWLLKVAVDKQTKKHAPFKVAAQTVFAMVGKAVKPATPPVGATEFKGKPATIQPWLGDELKTLSGVAPNTLTPSQKKDVAEEHVLDWLMSQHDTHGGNLVKLPTGEVVGIDKEQGWKYLLPSPKYSANTPEGDKLSTDYHPNSQYGEQEPYYNKFWKAFADGSMSFNPTVMKGAIAAVEKIPDDAFAIVLGAYGATAFPEDAATAAKFYDKALTRKKKIRAEFETFITDQFKKRTKTNGVFTFEVGWVPEGSTTPVPPGIPAVPVPLEVKLKKTLGAPHDQQVPKPTGFVPPSMAAFVGAASKLGCSGASVYKSALQQLHLYNNNITDAANQLSWLKSIPPEVALKRVKYVAKKLKAAGGWAAFEPGAAPQPGAPPQAVPTPTAASTYSPVTALNPPGSGTGGTPTTTFVPGNDGELGNTNVKMVSPSEAYKPPLPPPPPPVPAGFDTPPEGKMWEVKKASAFFATGVDGHLYKTKAPKNAAGEPDPTSPNLVAKFHGTTQSAVKEAFDQVGVVPVVPIKTKGSNVIALLKKDDWAKAQTSNKKLGVLVDLPPPPPPPSGKFMPIPQAGELKNAPSNAGVKELAKVQDALLGYGANYRLDGPNIEHHSMSAQRRIDTDGKQFYRFAFKLREPVWKKLKGFDSVTGQYKRASYNAKQDAFKETAHIDCSYDGRRWSAGAGSRLTLCTDDGKYALKGMVTAEVYPEPGQTPMEAFQKLLKSVDPSLGETLLKDPSPEDEKLLKLSALYWSAAPAEADALTETNRNVGHLTGQLKKLGYTDEQMDSIRFERAGIDQTVPVLPGRHKELQKKHGISHVSVAVSSPDKVMQQIRGGTVGVVQRLKHGFALSGTSAGSDIESGGADYVFTMPGKKAASGWSNNWGKIEMVYDPSELDRLDAFMYTFDGYGRTKGPKFHERHTLEKSAGSAAEIIFRQGLSSNKLLKIRCQHESDAQTLIQNMKDAGVTKVNGMTPEELVVVGNNFYDTFLKPAGY